MAEQPVTPAPSRGAAADGLVAGGLAAVLAWTTLCLGGFRPETMQVTGPAVLVLAAVVAVRAAWRGEFHRAALLPLPFVLYAAASAVGLAPARWLATQEALLWAQMAAVFFIVLQVSRTRVAAGMLAGTFALLVVLGTALAAYQWLRDPTWLMLGRKQVEQFAGRSSGMFGIPNSLAGFYELALPPCLVLLGARSVAVRTKVVLAWLAALGLAGLVLTISRGGWIALAAALTLWPLVGGGDWRRRLAGAAAVAVGCAVLFGTVYRSNAVVRERLRPFLAGEFEATRPVMWRVGVQLWQERPWTGTGAASYNVLFDRYRPRGFRNEPLWTHNDYLNTLSDYGVVGLVLWAGAGGTVLGLGWRAVRRARRETPRVDDVFSHWRWKLGLWLGLVAFALHLAVDFHTKIPALAFAAATAAGLLLRDTAGGRAPVGGVGRGALLVAGGALAALAGVVAWPTYRAEAWRYPARQAVDRALAGRVDLASVLPSAREAFRQAVALDPTNGQAWADLSLASALSAGPTPGDLAAAGREAAGYAARAIDLCPIRAEYHVRLGTALNMQGQRWPAELRLRQAIELAPTRAEWRYHLAYHLSSFPLRRAEALAAAETCLALDPAYASAKSLRERLISGP